jgi:hypothetical protein
MRSKACLRDENEREEVPFDLIGKMAERKATCAKRPKKADWTEGDWNLPNRD